MQYTQNSKPNPIWTCFHSLANDLAGLGLEQSLRWAEAGPNLDFLLSCIYNFEVMRVYSGTEELLHFTIVAVNGAHVSYQKELGWLWLSWIGPEGVLSLIVWVGVRWKFETVVKGSSLCPVPVSTEHVAMRIRVQDWTRVRILTGPVITDHWTEAQPVVKNNRRVGL